ncbi:unnamed protein product [Mesocestoides corti]|uniref:CAAX prenyl protease n=1 Tax=Mesocestoides corti TaxID=53468 RepID=A0A0R3ULB9_MESCO|nr:unnamed protein product [Mesocestoides corti]
MAIQFTLIYTYGGYSITFLNVILFFTWCLFIWETFLNLRQIRVAKSTKTPPKEIVSLMDEAAFDKAGRYSVEKLSGFYSISLLSVILHFQVIGWVWRKAVDHLIHSEILISLLFTVYFAVFQFFDSLPWSYYRNFVIEARYGFNKQTLGFFIKDKVKSLLVGLVIGLPIIAALIWIIKAGGQYFYIYAYGFTFAVSMIIMFIYPEFIAPIFDRYEHFPDCELRTKIEDLAAQIGFPLKKLFVVEGSKRSSHSNAYFYGFGKNKRIVLFDTLIRGFKMPNASSSKTSDAVNESDDVAEDKGCDDDEEILAVLAHELGHWKMNHVTINLIIAQFNIFFMFFVFGQLMNMDMMFIEFGFPPSTAPTVLRLIVIFQFLFMPYSTVLDFLTTMLLRKFEFQADAFAVSIKPGEKLKNALLVLTKDNLSFPVYDWLYSLCNLSHPSIIERIKAIDEAEKKKE